MIGVLVRTDDEVYRVDSVWLGPPRATFPWRARYVSYGVGLLVMIIVMFVQRRIGIGLDFFSVAWALVLTVVVTRVLGQRIDYERPLETSRNLTFGLGAHSCAGQLIARAEIDVIFTMASQRFTKVELPEAPTRVATDRLVAFEKMPAIFS